MEELKLESLLVFGRLDQCGSCGHNFAFKSCSLVSLTGRIVPDAAL
jgi:hypothetical protein